MPSALRKPAPHPEPAAFPLAGGDAAGAGLAVVDSEHWSVRLGKYRSSGMGDGWLFAAPLAGTAIGLIVRFGLWAQMLSLVAAALALWIVASLAVERVQKLEKRRRKSALVASR